MLVVGREWRLTGLLISICMWAGHSHPVYSLGLAGDAGAPTLVTASSDGKVCYWSLRYERCG